VFERFGLLPGKDSYRGIPEDRGQMLSNDLLYAKIGIGKFLGVPTAIFFDPIRKQWPCGRSNTA
jgi:hypothetical protein